jgi:hypothetical protein
MSYSTITVTDFEVLGCETELAFPNQSFRLVKWGSLVLGARTFPLSALQTKIIPNVDPIWKRALAIMPYAVDGIALNFPERGMPDAELKALVLCITFSDVGEHCVKFLVLRKLECDAYERAGHAILHTAFSMEKTKSIMDKARREVVVIE